MSADDPQLSVPAVGAGRTGGDDLLVPEIPYMLAELALWVRTEREPDRRGEVRLFCPAGRLPSLDNALTLRSQPLCIEVK